MNAKSLLKIMQDKNQSEHQQCIHVVHVVSIRRRNAEPINKKAHMLQCVGKNIFNHGNVLIAHGQIHLWVILFNILKIIIEIIDYIFLISCSYTC